MFHHAYLSERRERGNDEQGLPCLSAEAGEHEGHAQQSTELEEPICTQPPEEDEDKTMPKTSKGGAQRGGGNNLESFLCG